MTHRDELLVRWGRVLGAVASTASGLYLFAVLAFGALWLTTDSAGLGCFDGDEPACASQTGDAAKAVTGLAAIQPSSWLLAGAGVAALAAAVVLSWRMRRVRHLAAVVALCVFAAGTGATLYDRL